MASYTHLSLSERLQIDRGIQAQKSANLIAAELGRARSTISREIKRNQHWHQGYIYNKAHQRSLGHRRDQRCKIFSDSVMQNFVLDGLRLRWSPQIISGRWKLKKPANTISAESIYHFIYNTDFGKRGKLYKFLIKAQKARIPYGSRKKRGSSIQDRTPIHERSEPANNREEIGHWEGDLILNKGGNIGVLCERKSRFIMASKNVSKHSNRVIRSMSYQFSFLPGKLKKSVTFDQGTEFANHKKLTRLQGIKTYFCDPYSPWQKGAVENANGRLRRFIPKKADISKLTPRQLDAYIELMNNTPRVCLGYKTPSEVFTAYWH